MANINYILNRISGFLNSCWTGLYALGTSFWNWLQTKNDETTTAHNDNPSPTPPNQDVQKALRFATHSQPRTQENPYFEEHAQQSVLPLGPPDNQDSEKDYLHNNDHCPTAIKIDLRDIEDSNPETAFQKRIEAIARFNCSEDPTRQKTEETEVEAIEVYLQTERGQKIERRIRDKIDLEPAQQDIIYAELGHRDPEIIAARDSTKEEIKKIFIKCTQSTLTEEQEIEKIIANAAKERTLRPESFINTVLRSTSAQIDIKQYACPENTRVKWTQQDIDEANETYSQIGRHILDEKSTEKELLPLLYTMLRIIPIETIFPQQDLEPYLKAGKKACKKGICNLLMHHVDMERHKLYGCNRRKGHG